MARSLEHPEDIIGLIDGSVPVRDREDVLRRSRIIMMTPDVCHAWLMSRLSLPTVRNFVRALSTLVMDEAHTLEGVFGSNFSFLIRRLIAARNHLLRDEKKADELQLVAATATIANPDTHMKRLTGSDFFVVDHDDDGAPQHERIVAHLACPMGEERQVAKVLHNRVLADGREGGFITFLDSRKGVEGLVVASQDTEATEFDELLGDADVLPYRAGYDSQDRQKIEQRLQSGSLRGVVSTSALELGINIPNLRVGFNIGVPGTRKAYRQRLGRVGRTGPGAFVVVAPPGEFRRYGTTFREYHEMSVEPSYLYLDNRFMQFAHGRCLAVELESLTAPLKLPRRATLWPQGFEERYLAARPGGQRPPEFDAVAERGGDSPHHGYPLRNVGEVNFQIKLHSNSISIGDASQLQALRECYPGATYLHLAHAYTVAAWHERSHQPFIRVQRGTPYRRTRPRITTWINTGLTSADLLEGHVRKGEKGFLAECEMQITERVEGFVDQRTGEFHSYQHLQQHNPNLRARSRNFRTSGVVLCVHHNWFKDSIVKRAFADRLREVFVREYSVSPQDIGSASSNISVRTPDGGGVRGGCIAVFDETYGSLRLTERLYLEFDHVLERLSAAATVEEEGPDDNTFKSLVARVREELSMFSAGGSPEIGIEDVPTGYEQVFKTNSRVCYRQVGQLVVDVEIIRPTLGIPGAEGQLMYQVKCPPRPGQRPALRWIPASAVEPSGDADSWDYAWWNRETESYEDPPESAES